MPLSIRVRQGEVIVVKGATNVPHVADLFTTGMCPCIGLLLWHPSFCALAHIDDDAGINQCGPIIGDFAAHAAGNGQAYAAVVKSMGIGGQNGWEQTARTQDVINICAQHNLAARVLQGTAWGQQAIVEVILANGATNENFNVNKVSSHITRFPGAVPWVTSPTSTAAGGLRVGICQRTAIGQDLLRYFRGTDVAGFTALL